MNKPWTRVEIGEVLRRRPPDTNVVPFETYQFAGVYSFGRGVFRGQARRGSEFAYRTLTRLRKGDLTYPKLMAWEGAFGIVPAECDGCYVSPEFPVFEIDSRRVVPAFLGFYFQNRTVWKSISGGSTGTNVRRRRLNPEDFLRRGIPLPPLDEQQRVAAWINGILECSHEVRSQQHNVLSDLNEMLRSAFYSVIENSGRERMAEIAPLVRRPTPTEVAGSYQELGIRSFGKGTFHKPPATGASLGTKRIFRIKSGDLLFNIVFAWEGAVAVASTADDGLVGSHRFLTCVPVPGRALPEFLKYYFLTGEGLQQLGGASPGGAGRNRTLGIKALENICVPVPAISKQEWFVDVLKKAQEAEAIQHQALSELNALPPAILHRTFNGNL